MARPQTLTFQPPPVHTSLPRLLSRGNKHVLTSGPPPTLFLLPKAPFPILLGMLPPHRHLRWDHTDFSLTISGRFSPRGSQPRGAQRQTSGWVHRALSDGLSSRKPPASLPSPSRKQLITSSFKPNFGGAQTHTMLHLLPQRLPERS